VVCNPNPRARLPGSALLPACALAGSLCAALLGATTPARADAPVADPPSAAEAAERLRPLTYRVDGALRLFGSVEFGRGLRFNNPFRLATELGETARSVSLTAAYADLGLGLVYGPPDGLQHGGALHASFALAGTSQATLTPAYALAYRGPQPFLAYGRVGPSFILTPDPTVGAEVAVGFAWFLTGSLAIAGEVVFDLYYGAGTYDVGIASYPILSGQLGLLVDHEFLK
jgi:hypothetical protein